jgi:predicted dehydrogenase
MTIPHLRWGILGTGNIARKFAGGLLSIRERCTLAAVGSRSAASAAAFAAEHGGGCRAHGSYQALLDDPGIDVVYISLLNHQHAEWAMRAAEAGKHILCEKPATLTAAELERVLEVVAARGVFFMEGFLYRCHPRWAALRELLAGGAIGELRLLHASFAFNGGDRWDGRLLDRAQGGGGLMDVGCYAVSWLRWLAGGEPIATACLARVGTTGVDEWASGQLLFAGGVLGTFTTGVRVATPTTAALYGARGWIEVTEPWRGTAGKAAFIVHADGAEPRTVTVPDDGLITYAREALEVARHVHAHQSPAMTWADSLGQARTLDALRHQAGVRWPGEG